MIKIYIEHYVYCDKKECNLGESILFKSTNLTYNLGQIWTGSRDGINFYEDNVFIKNIENEFLSGGYSYTPSTEGTHTIKIEGYEDYYVTTTITVSRVLKEVVNMTIDDVLFYDKGGGK